MPVSGGKCKTQNRCTVKSSVLRHPCAKCRALDHIKKHTGTEERFHQKVSPLCDKTKPRQCATVCYGEILSQQSCWCGSARRCCGDTCTSAALPLPVSIPSCFLPPGPFQKTLCHKKKKRCFCGSQTLLKLDILNILERHHHSGKSRGS